MNKELIISAIIIVIVVIGNIFTQNYTQKSVKSITTKLGELREELIIEKSQNEQENQKSKESTKEKSTENTNIKSNDKNEVNWEKVNKDIENINQNWREKFETLAYFIEHDELEKVDTNLTGLKSFVETEEATDAISELDKSVFILKHIEDKNMINLKNIF